MNKAKYIQRLIRTALAGLLSVAMPALSFANISNSASGTYSDLALNNYTAGSNTVTTTTPPVITSASTASGNQGVAFSYQTTATNSPTSYGAAGLPAGLTVSAATGLISGTPTVSGTFTVNLTATNSAGSGTLPLVLTIAGSPNIVLTKSVDKANATSGATLTYTLQYQNTGTGDATNVVIKDVIPTGTTLVNGSITGGGTAAAGTITWTIGTVNAGAPSASVSFKVTVN